MGLTQLLRFFADSLFASCDGHRAIVLETIAAVPGMVGATATHLHSLRRMVNDDGCNRTLMEEAENERMHLMIFIEIDEAHQRDVNHGLADLLSREPADPVSVAPYPAHVPSGPRGETAVQRSASTFVATVRHRTDPLQKMFDSLPCRGCIRGGPKPVA